MMGEGPGKLHMDQNSDPTKMLSSVQGNLGNQEERVLVAALASKRTVRGSAKCVGDCPSRHLIPETVPNGQEKPA